MLELMSKAYVGRKSKNMKEEQRKKDKRTRKRDRKKKKRNTMSQILQMSVEMFLVICGASCLVEKVTLCSTY